MTNTCPWSVGSKTKTLIAFENIYGETPAEASSSAIRLDINSNGVACSQSSTAPSTLRGNRNPVEPILGNNDVSGDIAVPLDYVSFGYWLKAAFGTPSSAAEGSAGKYKHVFKVSDSQPSFTLEKAFPGINTYLRDKGCKVSKLSLSVGGDGELVATVSVMGAKEEKATASMSESPVEPKFARAQNFQASAKLGGNVKGKLTSFSIDIDFGLDGDTYCIGGDGYREAICEGAITVSGTLEAFFDSMEYLDMAANNTATSAEIIFTGGDNSISLLLPELKFARTSPSIDGPGGIKQSLTYNAYYENSSQGSAVVVTLVNENTAY